jgi:crotonobetainyl-CoA:carnitine CoA-transferase CaiB-like acyl-CoA transferase
VFGLDLRAERSARTESGLRQAYAGVTYLSGEEGGDYFPPALAVGDVSTGVHAYAAVATALLHRERTGEGQHLDISLLDSYFHYHDMSVELVSASRGAMRVERMGNQIGALSPAGIFRTKTIDLDIRISAESLGELVPSDGPAGAGQGFTMRRT